MVDRLSGSVGLGGQNFRSDVALVQRLLFEKARVCGQADGQCGPRTIGAIRSFQASFMKTPDGLVEVDGTTWKRLSQSVATDNTSLTRLIPLPAPGAFNKGLTSASNALMTDLFGAPRDSYSEDCQPLTNEVLKRNLSTGTIGLFRVTGLRPAIISLQQVFGQIAQLQPTVAPVIGTAGMLCCRYQRGSTSQISNHSWGTAIDLTLGGLLDKRGDNLVQYGLTLIAPIFNQFGWYWGATFASEDAMHFEASQSLANAIKAQLI